MGSQIGRMSPYQGLSMDMVNKCSSKNILIQQHIGGGTRLLW
jgi:hypothetical protein